MIPPGASACSSNGEYLQSKLDRRAAFYSWRNSLNLDRRDLMNYACATNRVGGALRETKIPDFTLSGNRGVQLSVLQRAFGETSLTLPSQP